MRPITRITPRPHRTGGEDRHRCEPQAGGKRGGVAPALAGIRDERGVAGLPEPGRRALGDLWRRVDAVRAKAATPDGVGASRNP